jgi:hypothetical protein
VFRPVGVADAHAIEDAVGAEEGVHTAISMTLADARRMALAAAAGGAMPAKESAARTLYVHSKAVRDYVLMRAAGRCDLSDQPALLFAKMARRIWSRITPSGGAMVGPITRDFPAPCVPHAIANCTLA